MSRQNIDSIKARLQVSNLIELQDDPDQQSEKDEESVDLMNKQLDEGSKHVTPVSSKQDYIHKNIYSSRKNRKASTRASSFSKSKIPKAKKPTVRRVWYHCGYHGNDFTSI